MQLPVTLQNKEELKTSLNERLQSCQSNQKLALTDTLGTAVTQLNQQQGEYQLKLINSDNQLTDLPSSLDQSFKLEQALLENEEGEKEYAYLQTVKLKNNNWQIAFFDNAQIFSQFTMSFSDTVSQEWNAKVCKLSNLEQLHLKNRKMLPKYKLSLPLDLSQQLPLPSIDSEYGIFKNILISNGNISCETNFKRFHGSVCSVGQDVEKIDLILQDHALKAWRKNPILANKFTISNNEEQPLNYTKALKEILSNESKHPLYPLKNSEENKPFEFFTLDTLKPEEFYLFKLPYGDAPGQYFIQGIYSRAE